MKKGTLKVVHISSSMNGGAGRAAFQLHKALLGNNILSFFLSLDIDSRNDNIACYSITKVPERLIQRTFKRVRNELATIGLIDRKRKRVINDFDEIKSSIKCEIASLPFSEYDILKYPIVEFADIIHLHWIAGVLDYPTFFKNCTKPLIFTLHDMNSILGLFHYKQDEVLNEEISWKLDREIKEIKHTSFKKIRRNIKIVTPSKWLADEVVKSGALPLNNISIIPNCVDTGIFHPSNKGTARRELSIPNHTPVLIFAAHHIDVRRKGFDLLLEALQSLKNKVTLIAIGGVDVKNSFTKDIIYTGIIADNKLLSKYYSAADAYILPSREDNLPNVMLESFACGTPVISFAVGGMREHVIPFKTGLLAESLTAESLKKTIDEFVLNKDVFDAKIIREYAEIHFNPAIQAEAYTKVYEDLNSIM